MISSRPNVYGADMVSTFDRGWYSSDAHGSPDPKCPHHLQVIPLSLIKFEIEWVLKLLCLIIFYGLYPRPVSAFGYCHRLRLWVCVSVCVCVNHELVRTVTHRLFKPGSPNLDQRCKTPWFRSLSFLGWSPVTFKVKLNLKVRFYLILNLSVP